MSVREHGYLQWVELWPTRAWRAMSSWQKRHQIRWCQVSWGHISLLKCSFGFDTCPNPQGRLEKKQNIIKCPLTVTLLLCIKENDISETGRVSLRMASFEVLENNPVLCAPVITSYTLFLFVLFTRYLCVEPLILENKRPWLSGRDDLPQLFP